MARKITTGEVGGAGSTGLNITNTVLSAATDLDIVVEPKGTGIFIVAGDTTLEAQGDLRFADADSSNWVAFQAPATVSANVTWTLPATDGGTGQFLATNAAGTLSWASGSLSLSDQTTSSSTHYPLITTSTSGTVTAANTSSTKFSFVPSTGTLSATIFNETSSIALKENFVPIDNALDKILSLTAWIYDRKDGSQKSEAGLIAEDVNRVIPNIVSKDANGNPLGINYTRLSAYLIEAVKSLKHEINELKGVK
jgi:hypothetical protein